MIDPISVIELSNTACSVAQKLTHVVKNLIEAPEEVLALSNETWNIQLVLKDWSEMCQNYSGRPDKYNGRNDVEGALKFQLHVKLGELNDLVTRCGKLSQWGRLMEYGST